MAPAGLCPAPTSNGPPTDPPQRAPLAPRASSLHPAPPSPPAVLVAQSAAADLDFSKRGKGGGEGVDEDELRLREYQDK